MKIFTLSLVAAFSITNSLAFAAEKYCQGYATAFQGASLIGNCSGGFCNASISQSSVTSYGQCNGGLSFSAQGFDSANVATNFSCVNGMFNAYLFPAQIDFSGICSDGSTFAGETLAPANQSVFGSCQENGPVFATIPALTLSVAGHCTAQ